MPISPQKLREIVLQLLFSEEFTKNEPLTTSALLMKLLAVTKKTMRTACALQQEILSHKKHIDKILCDHMKTMHLHALPSVERAILRLSGYELLFSQTLPPKVAIAEAVRMARKFATRETSALINGILDAIYQSQIPTTSSCKENLSS